MVKSVLILINLGVMAVLNLLFFQQIDIQHQIPAQLAPGESTEVEVTISKGKVSGFAKLQINVADGLTIESIENTGASFTFHDQKAKFIWMSLPEERTVTVRYRLTALPSAQGPQMVEGNFSYIDNNQRLVHEMPVRFVQTEGDAIASATPTPNNTSQAFASIHRTVEAADNGRFLVTVNIHKAHLSGFAKIEEDISHDFTAAAVKTDESVFNIVDNKVKFVWFDIPASNDVTIAYHLIPVTQNPNPDTKIEGEFSFLVNNETRSVKIADVRTEILAEETTDPIDDREIETEIDDEPIAEVHAESPDTSEEEQTQKAQQEEIEMTETLTATDETIPAAEQPEEIAQEMEPAQPVAPETPAVRMPETDITYRVQIIAASKLVDAQYFKKQHRFEEEYFVENHEGWVKYTTGRFDAYRAARDHRNVLTARYNFPGPFVTAYNDGARITVQEALMISNQKWVP